PPSPVGSAGTTTGPPGPWEESLPPRTDSPSVPAGSAHGRPPPAGPQSEDGYRGRRPCAHRGRARPAHKAGLGAGNVWRPTAAVCLLRACPRRANADETVDASAWDLPLRSPAARHPPQVLLTVAFRSAAGDLPRSEGRLRFSRSVLATTT